MPDWDDHPLKNNFPGYGSKDTENKTMPTRFSLIQPEQS